MVRDVNDTTPQAGIIYKATNIFNGKIYIGQTTKTKEERAAQHFSEAKSKADNYRFHNALRFYGEDAFKWEKIDETTSYYDANVKEPAWIAHFNSTDKEIGYNTKSGGLNSPCPDEVKQKIGESNSIPVYCFQTGIVYKSATEAEDLLNLRGSITKVLKGKHEQHRGYTFEYAIEGKEYPVLPLHPRKLKRTRPVYCHQIQKIYDDVLTAATELKTHKDYIHRHLRGEQDNCNGYTFEFVSEDKIYPLPKREMGYAPVTGEARRRPIRCNETGQVFKSITEAAKTLGIRNSGISSVLSGKYKYAGPNLTFSYV